MVDKFFQEISLSSIASSESNMVLNDVQVTKAIEEISAKFAIERLGF